MHRFVLEESYRLTKAYVDAERLCRQKNAELPGMAWRERFEDRGKKLADLVRFQVMVDQGYQACLRCSDREERCVMKPRSEFPNRCPYWCIACVNEYSKNVEKPKDIRR